MKNYYDSNFVKTNKKARVTFNGWDGKSYNGEAVNLTIYTCKTLPGRHFVVAYTRGIKTYHEITSEVHPTTGANLVKFYTYFDPITA